MKKKLSILAVMFGVLAIIVYAFASDFSGNLIKPYKMSSEMAEIASLGNMNGAVSIFEYDLSKVDGMMRVERLKLDNNGQWQIIEESGMGSSDIAKGRLAFAFDRVNDSFKFAFKSKGYAMSYPDKVDTKKVIIENKEFSFGVMVREEKVKIVYGERIILMLTYDNNGSYYDTNEAFFDNTKIQELNDVECIAITFEKSN